MPIKKGSRSTSSALSSSAISFWLSEKAAEVARSIYMARKHRFQISRAEMSGRDFAKHIAEVSRQREVAAFVQLIALQAGPVAVDLAAAH